jgi:peptidoglycan/xylan/chitin deacetylase (PgdA/CDA1 family)
MTTNPLVSPYQWDLRPQIPVRPEWFRAWPDGAAMAVQILILNEWESVPRHRKRPMAVDLQNRHDHQNKFDFLALGVREYGARHGIWRLLDVLDKHGVKATIPTNGLTAELFPAAVRASRDRGHEVAAHQWDMSVFPPMFTSREEEQSSLTRTVAAIEDAIGSKVRGYLSPGPRPTPWTLDLLMEGGLLWTSDYVDSDFPYVISRNDRRLVAISYATPGYTDGDLSSRGVIQGLAEIKYAFDATFEESKRHPMKFCYAIHPHVSGTVGMARLLDDFLAHVRSRGEVWLPTCSDIAEFWLSGVDQ